METVSVHSEADVRAVHTRAADQSVEIGPAPAIDSYLRIDRIVDAARRSGAEAVHPGYGFLAENADLARACETAGLVFVGPSADSMEKMGDKAGARKIAEQAGVPVVPGYDGDDQSDETLTAESTRIGFPLLIKPSAGGGGKGMKRVEAGDRFADALASARREAGSSFGNEHMVLERFLEPIRHIEIQVFGFGDKAVALFERECSLQRRHQKIIEECPSPAVADDLRGRMCDAAVRLAEAVGYRGAGTVEFILAEDGSFYFLEMNTRLQVEHPITEMTTGVDLVHEQLWEAMGRDSGLLSRPLTQRGHSIEARLYAEDPENGFLPSAGHIGTFAAPHGPGIRVDSGIESRSEVPVHYDPILAKIIVWAADREAARLRMRFALENTVVLGVRSNVGFLLRVLDHPGFVSGETTTDLVERDLAELAQPWDLNDDALALAVVAASSRSRSRTADSATGVVSDPESMYSPWARLQDFRLGVD